MRRTLFDHARPGEGRAAWLARITGAALPWRAQR